MKKIKEKNSVLLYYLFTYFVVFLIPILICTFLFLYLLSSLNQEVIIQKQYELEQTSKLIDIMLDEFSYLGDSIVSSVKVNRFKHEEEAFDYPNNYKIIEVKNELQNLYRKNSSIYDYFVLFNNSEIMINNQSAYKYDDFFNLYLHETEAKSLQHILQKRDLSENIKELIPMQTYLYKEDEYVNLMIYKQPVKSKILCKILEYNVNIFSSSYKSLKKRSKFHEYP